MFWKRKKNSSEIFSIETEERRTSYRVQPLKEEPVVFLSEDRKFTVINIGAKGVAFKSSDTKKGEVMQINLDLPGQSESVFAVLKVIQNENSLCRACFTEISDESSEIIHKYMLEMQKKKVRRENTKS